jgi:glycine betaine monooxygenase B
MMCFMRAAFDLGSPLDITYVHSARTPADILFRSELDCMASTAGLEPHIAVAHVCERDSEDEAWGVGKGVSI